VIRRALFASLALAPITIVLHYAVHPSATVEFVMAAISLIPLAWLIGEATEHAAEHTGPGIGGFLNATFGNAPELIIGLVALRAGLFDMVRASLIGLNVYLLRLTAFVMAGFLAGVAGALFAFFGRYASASYMFYHVSGEAVVWAIVGGAGTLFGPIIGTSLFIIIRELVSTHWEHHSLIVGIMAIVVVILAPRGLVGLWRDGIDRLTARDTGEPAAAKLPADHPSSQTTISTN